MKAKQAEDTLSMKAQSLWQGYFLFSTKAQCWKGCSKAAWFSFKYYLFRLCSYSCYFLFTLIAAYIMYIQLYHFIMPEILQYSEPVLYSEDTHKECVVPIGESVFIQDSKYNIHVYLFIPEIETNENLPAVNLEVWESEKMLGKAYRGLKKHQNFAGSFRRRISEIGVVLGLYEDVQEVKVTIPAVLRPESKSVVFKIFPADLAIQQVRVQFEVKLTGFRYYLHEHFTFACIVGCFWIMILEILIMSRIKQKVE